MLKLTSIKAQVFCYSLLILLFTSYTRAVTPAEAACGHFKKCRVVR